ncbi:hypothetical protein EBH_0020770 [Eimeria brunetti]|uniref:Uncharacterized protein n=1 Tax=Eimeria brunetti TaxID=51314 RepID=U6M1Z3_9EIME|nr:hypothetical protein EBH_0020770 [Eimeria brunetti]
MPIFPWTSELEFPVGHRDGTAQRSDSHAVNTGKPEGVKFASAHRNRNRTVSIINSSVSAILVFVLATYLCLSPIGSWEQQNRAGAKVAPVIRRLSSSDEDETCKDFIELIGMDDKEDGKTHPRSQEPPHAARRSRRTAYRKRRRSREKQYEYKKRGKKPFFSGESRHLTGRLQRNSGPLPSSSSEASSVQLQALSTQQFQLPRGFQILDEASKSSATQASRTTSRGADSMPGLHLLEEFFADDDPFDQRFLDFIFDPSWNSSPGSSVDHLKGAQELAGESRAKATGQPSASNTPSFEAEKSVAYPSPSSSSEAPSVQLQASSTQKFQLSGGLQRPDEASTPSATQVSETTSRGADSMPGLNLIEEFLADDDPFDQRFLDFIFDPSWNSSPGSSADHLKGAQELAGESRATADQLSSSDSPSSEGESSAAQGSANGHAQRPVLVAQDVPGTPKTPEVSTEGSSSASTQESQRPMAEEGVPKATRTPLQGRSFLYVSAPTTIFYNSQASAGGLPSPAVQITAEDKALQGHPFYRLPRARCTQTLTPFNFGRAIMYSGRQNLTSLLTSVRELLIKPDLQPNELQLLISLGEGLVKNVHNMGNFQKGEIPLYKVYKPIARRFLIADALWSICEVVGVAMKKEEWWCHVLDKLMLLPNMQISSRQMRTSRYRYVSRMVAALHTYRDGRRPPPKEVVELKRDIFCSRDTPEMFRSSDYDKFRDDDTQ